MCVFKDFFSAKSDLQREGGKERKIFCLRVVLRRDKSMDLYRALIRKTDIITKV